MGSVMNAISCGCNKDENMETEVENEEDKEKKVKKSPQTLIDVKIDTKNFVRKNTKNIREEYEDWKELGEGAFGKVYKAKSKRSGQIRAIKEMTKENILESVDESEIVNEINILRKLDHPNIMKIYEYYEDEKSIYYVSEFCNGGDLAEKMDKHNNVFCEFLVKFIMYQILQAVAFLHNHKVLHGDIKRENILCQHIRSDFDKELFEKLAEDKSAQEELMNAKSTNDLRGSSLIYLQELKNTDFKLVDFGSSKMKKKKGKLSGCIGTAFYCAPEVIDDNYDLNCDEFACGVLMYILLAGIPPFNGDSEEEVFEKIKNDEPSFKKLKVSRECKDLINKLLTKDAKRRITAERALREDFFTKGINIASLNSIDTGEKKFMLSVFASKTLKGHKKKSVFKEAVIAYIALNFADKEEENKIKEIFRDLSNGDEHYIITKYAFKRKFKEIVNNTDEELEELFDNIDENNSGTIEFQELIRSLGDKKKLLTEDNLKRAFDFFDEDHGGTISWGEIAKIIFKGKEMPPNIIKDFLKEIGKEDETMEINFEEFKTILCQE